MIKSVPVPNVYDRFLEFSSYKKSDMDKITIHISDVKAVVPHFHNFIEFIYVLEGSANHILNGKTSMISKGDYILLDFCDCHSYTAVPGTGFKVINILFTPDFFDNSLYSCRSFTSVISNCLELHNANLTRQTISGVIYSDIDGQIKSLIDKVVHEFDGDAFGRDILIKSYMTEILISVVRSHPDIIFKESSEVVRKMLDYVEEHICDKISFDALCNQLGYCVPYLSRKFKKEIGVTFSEYIQQAKIRKACDLLLSTNMKIGNVAESLGYNNPKHFQELFKKYVGCSPRAFAKANSVNKKK